MQTTLPQPDAAAEAFRPDDLAEKIGLGAEQLQAILEQLQAESGGETGNWLTDRVLARACAAGHDGAWRHFIAGYEPRLMAMATRLTRDPEAARELVSDLYGDLYGLRRGDDSAAPDPSRLRSKFRLYSGRGPLLGWLRALLAQMRVNQIRRQRPQIPFDEAPLEAHAVHDPEFEAPPLLRQLAAPLDLALAAVLEQLPPKDCTLLALYFLDHQTLAAIGALYGVHEATISRRLGRVLRGLRRGLRKELLARNCSLRQIEELMQADVRDIPSRFRSLLRRWSLRQRAHSRPADVALDENQPAPADNLQASSAASFSKSKTQQPDRRERPAMPFGLSRS